MTDLHRYAPAKRPLAVLTLSALLALMPVVTAVTNAQTTSDTCPDGSLKFGVEPYEDAAILAPDF